MDQQKWERRVQSCNAVAAIVSAIALLAGGAFGLYTYRQQGLAAEALKEKELRLMQFNQKKEVYYELVEAAAAVGTSTTKEEAIKNAARYSTLYFGRAHIFAIDEAVSSKKVAFRDQMEAALLADEFPCAELENAALDLSTTCADVLRVEDVYGPKTR